MINGSRHEPDADQPICVYDTGCGICTKLAKWASARSDIRFTGPIDLSERGVQDSEYAQYVVYAGHTIERAHRAVGAVLMSMDRPWTWLGRFTNWKPIGPIAAAVYRFVAINRSRIPAWMVRL